MKYFLTFLLVAFSFNSIADEVSVKTSFKNYIPKLKAYALTSDINSSKVSYLIGNRYNSIILNNYGTAVIHDDYISIDGPNGYQCTAFVKSVSDAGYTGGWKKGSAVSALTEKYSVVATFSDGENYGNDGNSHVGIYVGQTSDGIYLLDQNYTGTGNNPVGKIAVRLIPWSSSSKLLQASAKNYYVVEKD